MAELAILLPLLVLLVFGITELGRALYQQNTLVKAIESGARYLGRVYEALDRDTCEPTEEGDWELAKDRAWNLVVFGDENPGGTELLPFLAANFSKDDDITVYKRTVEGTTVTACVIKIVAEVPFDTLFGASPECIAPYLCLDEPLKLHAAVEERWIGE